jgi:peptidylprolyl isomerase
VAKVKKGDKVTVSYAGKLADGSVFDTTEGRVPFGFIVGGDQVLPSFSKAVIGMEAGDEKTVTILAEDAYGPYYDDLTRDLDRSEFPDGTSINKGQPFPMTHQDGSEVMVTIKEVSDEVVTIDANHPMAGKDLTFKIKILSIAKNDLGDGFYEL